MKKVLFITNRNVITTCGALRLIKNRAEVLYRDYGVVTDFCVFQRRSRLNSEKRENIQSGGDMSITGYSLSTLFLNLISFRKNLYKMLALNNYDAIIISQVCLKVSIPKIKRITQAPIILDGHGASEDTFESARGGNPISFFLRKMAYYIDVDIIRYYLKRIDGCLVVSKGLQNYYQRLTDNNKLRYFRVPCATIDNMENLDYSLCREQYRKQLGISDNDLCFVYSGGIEPWQSVEETIQIFKSISDNIDINCKMFIFSYEVELVRRLVNNDNRFYVMSFQAEELKKALCAMDYAFLLRKNTITNNVAYPNKFLEYLLARLKVISTPYVYDVAEQIKNYDVGFIYDFGDNLTDLINYIKNKQLMAIKPEIVKDIINDNSFKARLSDFVSFIDK